MRKHKLQETMERIVSGLVEMDYELIAGINLRTETLRIYGRKEAGITTTLDDELDYNNEVRRQIKKYVVSGEIEYALRKMKLSEVRSGLKKTPIYMCTFAVKDDTAMIGYRQWKFRYLDDKKESLLMTRSNVSNIYISGEGLNDEFRLALIQEKEDFFSRLSHEIRSPLNAMIGMATIGLKEDSNEKQLRDCLSKIHASTEYLYAVLNDITDLKELQNRDIVINEDDFSLQDLLADMYVIITEKAKKKDIDFRVSYSNFVEELYVGDRKRVKQVLLHVVFNAIQFTPNKGSVRLTMEQVSKKAGVVNVRFVVNDTGIGMKPEFVADIFKPFRQEHTGIYHGTGLGLPICKEIVELFHGSIVIDSIENSGTNVVIELPFKVAEPKEKEWYNFFCKKILVVEDNPISIEILKKLLEEKNAKVEIAEHGLAAIEMFVANPVGYYDAILMDIQMPLIDGLTASKSIRNTKKTDSKSIPIIAISANVFEEDRKQSKEAGMNAHIAKPLNPQILFKTLNQLI